jgi:hypothetical protein
MLPTKIYTFTLTAGQTYRLQVQGEYFKITSASGPVDIVSNFGRLDGMQTGQGLENTPFNDLVFTNASGASNTVKVLIGDQNFIDAMSGNMSIINNIAPQSSSFVNLQKTVTNASALLLAANPARENLLIQNNDGAGYIYVSFGAAATLLNGIKIGPGGSYEQTQTISTQDIYCIGSLASNANVVTVEG